MKLWTAWRKSLLLSDSSPWWNSFFIAALKLKPDCS